MVYEDSAAVTGTEACMSIQLLDVPLYNAQPDWGQANVDWTHPLSRGLISYMCHWSGSATGQDALNNALWDAHNLAWPIGPGLQWAGNFANYHIGGASPRQDDEHGRGLYHDEVFRACDATDVGIAGTTSEYTFAYRFMPKGLGGYRGLAGINTFAPGLYHSLSGTGRWGIYHGADIPANTTLALDTWYTLVATRRRGRIWYYLNGVWDGDTANSSSIASGNITVSLGTSPTTGAGIRVWGGFWNRAFEADEAEHIHFRPYDFVTPGYNELPVWVPNAPAAPTIPTDGFAVGSATLNTFTGQQDLTLPGFGTPQAAFFLVGPATANKSIVSHASFCMNWANSTSGKMSRTVWMCEDNVNPSDTYRGSAYDTIASGMVLYDGTGTLIFAAATRSDLSPAGPITDGWRINITTAPPAGYKITFVLIGGGRTAGIHGYPATATSIVLAAKPSAIFGYSNLNVASGTLASGGGGAMGFSDGTNNACHAWFDLDNVNPTQSGGYVFTDAYLGQASTGVDWKNSIGSFQSSNPQATSSNTGSPGTDTVLIQPIYLNNTRWASWVGVVDSPTSAASNWVVTPAGLANITPKFVIVLPNMHSATGTLNTTGDGGSYGIAVHDTINSRCWSMATEDAQTPSDTQTVYAEQWIYFARGDGTIAFDIHPSSNPFYKGGWTVAAADITTADSTARKWPVLVLGTTTITHEESATISANGTLTGGRSLGLQLAAALTAEGTMSAQAGIDILISASMTSDAVLAPSVGLLYNLNAELTANGDVQVARSLLLDLAVALSADGVLDTSRLVDLAPIIGLNSSADLSGSTAGSVLNLSAILQAVAEAGSQAAGGAAEESLSLSATATLLVEMRKQWEREGEGCGGWVEDSPAKGVWTTASSNTCNDWESES